MLFFSIGACLAARGWSLFAADKYGSLAAVAYVPLVVADVSLIGSNVSPYLHGVGIAIGVIAILSLTRIVVACQKLSGFLISLTGASFFVFAAHEPLLTAVRKIVYKITTPESSNFVLALYFLIPICVIAVLVVTHKALAHIAPAFLGIVTGEKWRQRR